MGQVTLTDVRVDGSGTVWEGNIDARTHDYVEPGNPMIAFTIADEALRKAAHELAEKICAVEESAP
jgi:hypothetical protein